MLFILRSMMILFIIYVKSDYFRIYKLESGKEQFYCQINNVYGIYLYGIICVTSDLNMRHKMLNLYCESRFMSFMFYIAVEKTP